MKHFPVFMDLKGRSCLVVGGGHVAARKVGVLRRAGAHVLVMAPELCPALEYEHQKKQIAWRPGPFTTADLRGRALAIAATDDATVNRRVSASARRAGIPVNVVDRPALCSFIFPAIVERDPVTIAISSGGRSPMLARRLRARLETLIPSAYGRLAQLCGRWRETVKTRLPEPDQRRRFWDGILDGPVAELALRGDWIRAQSRLCRALSEPARAMGDVALVGAGPGDPELLTLKALRLLQRADVVVYDRLVSPQVLDLARRDAERIFAGKQPGLHAMTQDSINALLVRLAQEGNRVVRLKGGDPFVFGRGGEETQALAATDINFQVVPGITAASGCAAYAGIPLTHREHAQSVRFVTAHRRCGRLQLDWRSLSLPGQTLVFYMALGALDTLCAQLVHHGLAAGTPAALVEQGTTSAQRVIAATLRDLPDKVRQARPHGPALVIVGTVVGLRRTVRWHRSVRAETSVFGHVTRAQHIRTVAWGAVTTAGE